MMSCNELGFEELAAAAAAGKQPVVVFVASSTGDGDAPDNSAKFYATLRCVRVRWRDHACALACVHACICV